MSVVIDITPAPSPEELAAARAGIELAALDQMARSEGRHVHGDELEALADRVGEIAVDAAMHASLDILKEMIAGREAQMACLRAMRGAGQETLP